jgi:DNA-binding transcriptional LysR family regulator
LTLATTVRPDDAARGLWDLRIVFGTPLYLAGQSDVLLGETLEPVARPDIAEQITRPADLLEHPLIEATMHRAGWAYVLEHLGVAPGRAQTVTADNTMMAAALAQNGVGIALARRPASDAAMNASGLVPCLEGARVPGRENYHLTYPDRATLRRPARAFRDWLMAHCAGLPPV